ncbi:MAG: transglycosylase domain-containing protein, partial [Acidobacteria bacterium]|nr:transglycosylase domain-containing protein [Acidobacteriota bacterium]
MPARAPQKHQLTPRRGILRRVFFNPWVLAFLLSVALMGIGAFTYFYSEASSRLDAWLADGHGQINPTNFYAAPLLLRPGLRMPRDRVLEYLSRASYAEANKGTGDRRGQFLLAGHALEIHPSRLSDGQVNPRFPSVRVKFGEGGRVIQSIEDLGSRRRVDECRLEPELIATITRQLGGASGTTERGLRYEVGYAQLPANLVNAVIAIEDKRFFQHTGVDYLGLVRALLRSLLSGERLAGTSTITQQLVK